VIVVVRPAARLLLISSGFLLQPEKGICGREL